MLSLAFVAHTDALVVGGAARLQQRRAATHMGIFDAFVNAFMEKEEFDDRSAKGACHLLIRRSCASVQRSSAMASASISDQGRNVTSKSMRVSS